MMRLAFIERNDQLRTIDFNLNGLHVGHIRYAMLKHGDGREIPIWESKLDIGKWRYRAQHMIDAKLSRVIEDLMREMKRAGDRLDREAEKLA